MTGRAMQRSQPAGFARGARRLLLPGLFQNFSWLQAVSAQYRPADYVALIGHPVLSLTSTHLPDESAPRDPLHSRHRFGSAESHRRQLPMEHLVQPPP